MATAENRPSYIDLHRTGELERVTEKALSMLSPCRLCPRRCGAERLHGEKGVCKTGRYAVVASFSPHFGEEKVLVGSKGSGTIFFSGCNLGCVYCQNYQISQYAEGAETSPEELARCMLELEKAGCHNLNLVTPTHVVPQILEALVIAVERGFSLPIVYNSGGYDSPETLKLLKGVVDIYMPDIKYLTEEPAARLSGTPDYPGVVKAAVKEMHGQVGDLVPSESGTATKGLLVRHLVLPGLGENTKEVLKFIAEEISPNTYTNIMNQYHPCYRSGSFPPLDEPLRMEEWLEAVKFAGEIGITRLDRKPPFPLK